MKRGVKRWDERGRREIGTGVVRNGRPVWEVFWLRLRFAMKIALLTHLGSDYLHEHWRLKSTQLQFKDAYEITQQFLIRNLLILVFEIVN